MLQVQAIVPDQSKNIKMKTPTQTVVGLVSNHPNPSRILFVALILNLIIYLICMNACLHVCMYVHQVRARCWIPWSSIVIDGYEPQCVLATELWSSRRATSVLNC